MGNNQRQNAPIAPINVLNCGLLEHSASASIASTYVCSCLFRSVINLGDILPKVFFRGREGAWDMLVFRWWSSCG